MTPSTETPPDESGPPRAPLPRPVKGALVLAIAYWGPLLATVGLVRLIVMVTGTTEGPLYGLLMVAAILAIYVTPILGTVGGLTGTLLGLAGLIGAVREQHLRAFTIVVTALCLIAVVLGVVQFTAGSGWLLRPS